MNDPDDHQGETQGYGRLKDGLKNAGLDSGGSKMVWWDRDYLPHVESPDLIQHVCFRLADSLPRAVVEQMKTELQRFPLSLRVAEKEKRVNDLLDAGRGSCILRDAFVASMVQDTLLYFHGDRYELHAWCIMPNHVHVLFQTNAGWTMSKIVASWKSFTGRRISAYWKGAELNVAGLEPGGPKGRRQHGGSVWHREYFDRFMRNGTHYTNTVNYIHMNPVKAGLVQEPQEWKFSSAAKTGRSEPNHPDG